MKITLEQINTTIGDVAQNTARIIERVEAAGAAGVDLVVFHEMCISGYPPGDLVERAMFLDECAAALAEITARTAGLGDLGVVVGLPMATNRDLGTGVANVAALVSGGRVRHRQAKSLLPTYDVFDEDRYFDPAETVEPVSFKGQSLGISICEDAWNDPALFSHRLYDIDPIAMLADGGATLLINTSASPFTVGKEEFRLNLLRSHAKRHRAPIVFVNQVGANDELVFDGRSMYVDADGSVRAVLPMFEEASVTVDTDAPGEPVAYEAMDEIASIRAALTLGTRDYMRKCGFSRALVGVSGGIDSAVTLALAVEALGAENVMALGMPSPYSSKASVSDAEALAANLGVELRMIPIADIMAAYGGALTEAFAGTDSGVTEENIQARIRGNILMAFSNKFGYLVLSTGNKSELAVGYCTLYGDMSGGLAVISDVPKTDVYRLARLINRAGEVIPENIINKAPSAELKPDQKDQDSLPPYDTLDQILDLYIEESLSPPAIIERGFDESTVEWVAEAVRKNEYKRKQAAPGLKVTSKAFGSGRRFPIAARYDV